MVDIAVVVTSKPCSLCGSLVQPYEAKQELRERHIWSNGACYVRVRIAHLECYKGWENFTKAPMRYCVWL